MEFFKPESIGYNPNSEKQKMTAQEQLAHMLLFSAHDFVYSNRDAVISVEGMKAPGKRMIQGVPYFHNSALQNILSNYFLSAADTVGTCECKLDRMENDTYKITVAPAGKKVTAPSKDVAERLMQELKNVGINPVAQHVYVAGDSASFRIHCKDAASFIEKGIAAITDDSLRQYDEKHKAAYEPKVNADGTRATEVIAMLATKQLTLSACGKSMGNPNAWIEELEAEVRGLPEPEPPKPEASVKPPPATPSFVKRVASGAAASEGHIVPEQKNPGRKTAEKVKAAGLDQFKDGKHSDYLRNKSGTGVDYYTRPQALRWLSGHTGKHTNFAIPSTGGIYVFAAQSIDQIAEQRKNIAVATGLSEAAFHVLPMICHGKEVVNTSLMVFQEYVEHTQRRGNLLDAPKFVRKKQ